MGRSENAYREVVKRNLKTGQILQSEVVIGDTHAEILCDVRNDQLTAEEKLTPIRWSVKGPATGPVTIRLRRARRGLPSGRGRRTRR